MKKKLALGGIGGALGTLLRFSVQSYLHGPAGTFAVNLAGSLLLGYLNGLFSRSKNQNNKVILLFWGTGFCGGFTTMSTFSGDAYYLLANHSISAYLYICLTIALCILAALSGFLFGTGKAGGA